MQKNYNSSKINVLLTGVTGFIGSHLLNYLINNFETLNINKLYLVCRNINKLHIQKSENIIVIENDLSTITKNTNIIPDLNYVFHIAGQARFRKINNYYNDNVLSIINLIDMAKDSTMFSKFVFVSTIGVMDRSLRDFGVMPLSEEYTCHPTSEYGKSKLLAENILINSKLPYLILRPGWVFGHNMRKDSHVEQFIEWAAKRKPVIYLNFPGLVNLISIDDFVDTFNKFSFNQSIKNEIIIISWSKPFRLEYIFKVIRKYFDFKNTTGLCTKYLRPILRILPLPFSLKILFFNGLWVSTKKATSYGMKESFNIKEIFENYIKERVHEIKQ